MKNKQYFEFEQDSDQVVHFGNNVKRFKGNSNVKLWMISYKKIHPQLSVKDFRKTIDKMVCLQAYS